MFRSQLPIILYLIYSEHYFAPLIEIDEYSETEWRAFVKFSVKLNRSPTDIISDLKEVMGDNAPHNATIYRWIERFRAGNQSCEDEARSGRPKSSRTDENVATVQQLITTDPQLSIEMIAEHTGLSYGNVQTNSDRRSENATNSGKVGAA